MKIYLLLLRVFCILDTDNYIFSHNKYSFIAAPNTIRCWGLWFIFDIVQYVVFIFESMEIATG